MALRRLTSSNSQLLAFPIYPPHSSKSPPVYTVLSILLHRQGRTAQTLSMASVRRWSGGAAARASPPQQQQAEEERAGREDKKGSEWGKVSAVLFDMDGVLCNSEELSRMAAVDVFAEMGVSVTVDDFVPFMGTGEANFLGGVASVKGVTGFDPEAAKKRFFEIYLDKYAKPNSGIGFPGALELIRECKRSGFKVAVASSADRIKVDANLAAAGLPLSIFDAIVSADAFENLKPAPDIFLAASKSLSIPPSECIVIEDALAGVQAAKAAHMREAARIEFQKNGAFLFCTEKEESRIFGAEARSAYASIVYWLECPRLADFVYSKFKHLPHSGKPHPQVGMSYIINEIVPSAFNFMQQNKGMSELYSDSDPRCIAVTTTLTEETLQQASPSLIRKDIGNVSIHDILNGGHSGHHNEELQHPQVISSSGNTSSKLQNEKINTEYVQEINSTSKKVNFFGGLQGSRREILRYGSLGIAVSCLLFTISNWKAMQFASVKGILNLFKGTSRSIFGQNEGESQSSRIQQIKNYLSDLEARGSASNVPEFPSKLEWLNAAPLQLYRNLKGRVVLLDFWTYCCINCMHVLPDLEFLERKYSDKPFTVIGVHSAKFDNEKDLEAIRNAVLRYNITHPVVNDGDMYLWRELGVNSWPTFVIVGPNGKLLAQISGEGHRKDLDDFVDASLQYYGEKKLLENNRILLALEKDNDRRLLTTPLKFPGKLAVDMLNTRLFISDSNHNRIVVTNLEGNFIIQVGSTGEEGLIDGTFDSACFNRPQGLAYNPKKNLLYVADTENHALREIDFINETVRTLAGNGTKGSDYKGGQQGTAQVLNSPWDVCYEPSNGMVYIAMAGQHQLWEHNTSDGITKAFSGDGYERNLNGSSSTTTSYAQPSGISLSPDLQELYVADSESSSIRVVDLKTGGSRLLAGGDPIFPENLFRFGDHDGIGSDALFQHPLGVLCRKDNQIYIADSYNHKIKNLDPITKKVTTLAGTGSAGFKDGMALSAQLSEPSGIVDAGNGRLLIADTNNNMIRYIDLNEKDLILHTLELRGVQPPFSKPKSLKRLRRRLSADTQIIKTDGGSSMEGYLNLAVSVPEGYHFSKEALSKFDVESEPANAINIEPSNGNLNPDGTASLHFGRTSPSPATGRINCKVYYCKEDEVCLYKSLVFDVSFQQGEPKSSKGKITLSYFVTPKVPSGTSKLVFSK